MRLELVCQPPLSTKEEEEEVWIMAGPSKEQQLARDVYAALQVKQVKVM